MDIADPLLYDTIAIACVIISVFLSLTKGLVREVISLVVWGLSFWTTYLFYETVANQLARYFSVPSIAQLVGVAATFIISLVVFYFIGKSIASGLRTAIPTKIDYAGGMAFGFFRGALLPAILFNLFLLFSISPHMQSAILSSYSYQYTKHISHYIFGVSPEQIIARANQVTVE